MRAMWSGNVTFGLVHIPVKLYAATEDRDVRFHQVHLADGGRIKYLRQCQTCQQTVGFSEIGKGYEDDAGRRIIVDEEELDSLQVPHGRDVEIVQFAPEDQIDPLAAERAYYLEPASGAAKPYVLLRQALTQTERVAVVTMSLRKRTRLALLRVRGDVLVLQTMLWPDEIRVPQFPGITDADVTVRPQELAMAGSLVESLSSDFDPSAFRDEYREAVLDLLEQKLAGQEVTVAAAPEEAASGTVIDLMAALQESVRRSKAARGGEEPEDAATKRARSTPTSTDGQAPAAGAADADGGQGTAGEGNRPASGKPRKKAPAKRAAGQPAQRTGS